MVREKLIFKVPIEVAPTAFHPSDLTGGQLYLRKDQATASSWISDIGTARDFVQGTATQQPTIGTNTVDFDGVNDAQKVTESDAFGSDFSGIMFFSVEWNNPTGNDYIFSSADESVANMAIAFAIFSGKLKYISLDGATTQNLNGTNSLVTGYNYGYIRSDSSKIYFSLNGATEVLGTGTANVGEWFGDVNGRDNLLLGGLQRNTTSFVPEYLNKLYYNNTALTSGEIADMNTFMSVPTNY